MRNAFSSENYVTYLNNVFKMILISENFYAMSHGTKVVWLTNLFVHYIIRFRIDMYKCFRKMLFASFCFIVRKTLFDKYILQNCDIFIILLLNMYKECTYQK